MVSETVSFQYCATTFPGERKMPKILALENIFYPVINPLFIPLTSQVISAYLHMVERSFKTQENSAH